MNVKKLLSPLACLPLLFAGTTSAATIDVLWVSGSATYNNNISQLAAGNSLDAVNYDPLGDGSLSWNIDFWQDGTVDFATYDVLVIGSSCVGGTGGTCNDTSGFYNLGVLPQNNVLQQEAAISAARGDRTFVSGQDADWHFMNDSSSTDRADARAFLVNAVNWAGSGTGMGVVALADGHSTGGAGNLGWLANANSFLFDDFKDSRNVGDSENVLIPAASASFPINEGLTSSSLSGWGTSSHTYFTKANLDPSEWLSINDYGVLGGDNAVTIVTASQASGGTTGKVPEPGTIGLASLGVLLLTMRRKKVTN